MNCSLFSESYDIRNCLHRRRLFKRLSVHELGSYLDCVVESLGEDLIYEPDRTPTSSGKEVRVSANHQVRAVTLAKLPNPQKVEVHEQENF